MLETKGSTVGADSLVDEESKARPAGVGSGGLTNVWKYLVKCVDRSSSNVSIFVLDSELGNGLRSVCNGEANHLGPPTAATQGDGRASQPYIRRKRWVQLDAIDLERELRRRVPTIEDCPRWSRRSLGRGYMMSLHEWRRTKSGRSWKLFILTTRMPLRPTKKK